MNECRSAADEDARGLAGQLCNRRPCWSAPEHGEPSGSDGAEVHGGERPAGGRASRQDGTHVVFEAVTLLTGERLRQRLLDVGASGLGAVFFSTSQSLVGSGSGTSTSSWDRPGFSADPTGSGRSRLTWPPFGCT
jgi:hypothetical protein